MASKKDNDCTVKSPPPPTYMATYFKGLRARRIKLKATDELHGAWADRKFRFYQAEKKAKGKGKGIQSEVDKLHAEWQATNKMVEEIDREIFTVQMMMHAHRLRQEMGGNGTAGGTAGGSDNDCTPGGSDNDCTPGGSDNDCTAGGDGADNETAGGDDDDEKETTGGDDDDKKVFYIYIRTFACLNYK